MARGRLGLSFKMCVVLLLATFLRSRLSCCWQSKTRHISPCWRYDLTGTKVFSLSARHAHGCLYFGGRTVIFIGFGFRLGSSVV